MNVVETAQGVKIYNVSSGKSLPEWLSEKKKRALRYDPAFRTRLELLQDAAFPIASQRVKLTPDGRFLVATGIYKPQVKVFELAELSMKFERHLDSEIVQFQILSEDFSKMVFLHSDRTVEFHARFGTYHKTRIPKFGRDMTYDPPSCDLFFAASGSKVYRLNLEQGRFLAPLQSTACATGGHNVCGRNPVHGLLGFGGSHPHAVVEFWDPRSKERVAELSLRSQLMSLLDISSNEGEEEQTKGSAAAAATLGPRMEVTALRYAEDGLTMAVGTSTGHCFLYDLRSSRPLYVKDHQYGLPIVDLKFHSSRHVISTDQKIVKIWNHKPTTAASGGGGDDMGKVFANIEPSVDINDVCVTPDTGLITIAGEQPKLMNFYIPALGPAPAWCSFLDNLTEELEENYTTVIYDDYKFITQKELEKIGADKMIGTNYLRPYMHGFFMDVRLYNKLKTLADPFAYEKLKAERISRIRQEQAQTRISSATKKAKKPKVNPQLAKSMAVAAKDDRFSAMLTDKSFSLDEASASYKRIHTAQQIKAGEEFEPVKETTTKKRSHLAIAKAAQPDFFELKHGEELRLGRATKQEQKQKRISLERRLQKMEQETPHALAMQVRHRQGAMEMSFTPAPSKKEKKEKELAKQADESLHNNRRRRANLK
ncbi:Nucleolar protein 10 [Balamuthia mandrillaris]